MPNTIHIVYRSTNGFESFDEEALRSFEDKQDADIFVTSANEEHRRLMNEYEDQLEQYNAAMEIWRHGKHKVKAKTGPLPVYPTKPVNKYDPENDDFSLFSGYSDEPTPRVEYYTKPLEMFATGEWQDA